MVRIKEPKFTQQVIQKAEKHGWSPFHLRDRYSINIVRGKGFPDLIMYRYKDDKCELFAAELKRDLDNFPNDDQEDWLQALGYYIPTYAWWPEDWMEIDYVLEYGPSMPAQLESAIQSKQNISEQALWNFRRALTGVIETIEDREYGSGPRAELRRMDPACPSTPAFWRLMQRDGMPDNPDLAKWGLITHGIALMSHNGSADDRKISFGRALYQSHYSEARLEVLLSRNLSDHDLHIALAGVFYLLANSDMACDWHEIALFILQETNESRNRIADAYYRAEYQNRGE